MKTFDEIYESLPGNGWLSRPEAELLWRAASATEGPILEVGCYEGRSTVLLASLGRPLTCVDPFDGFSDEDPMGTVTYKRWHANVLSHGFMNVELYMARIELVDMAGWPDFGFAYLDGDHTFLGTVAQIKAAKALSARGIGIHDYNDSGGGLEVKRAALEMLGEPDERAERLAVWRRA